MARLAGCWESTVRAFWSLRDRCRASGSSQCNYSQRHGQKDQGRAGSGNAQGRCQDGAGDFRDACRLCPLHPARPEAVQGSPRWFPVLLLGFLIAGMVVILCNYLGLLPGGAKNEYLLVGLGLITLGFITATRYK